MYEKVSPGLTTTPFNLFIANFKFVVLGALLASYFVLKVESKSGKASLPILFVVISGVVIFKSITYSSLSSFNISLAASKSKSTPSTCG